MKKVKEKRLSIDTVPVNTSIATSDGVVENHIFFQRNTQDIMKKHPALAGDEEIVFQPFLQ